MQNKADCFKIKKIKRKKIRKFKQRYSVEPKGFEMNESKGTFVKNQNFLQICRSSLAPDGYTIGQVRLDKCLSLARMSKDWLILVEIYVI